VTSEPDLDFEEPPEIFGDSPLASAASLGDRACMSGDCPVCSAANLGDLAASIGERCSVILGDRPCIIGDLADNDRSGEVFREEARDEEFTLPARDRECISGDETPRRLRNRLDFFFAANSGLSSRSYKSVNWVEFVAVEKPVDHELG
jgi:hypothetical protein